MTSPPRSRNRHRSASGQQKTKQGKLQRSHSDQNGHRTSAGASGNDRPPEMTPFRSRNPNERESDILSSYVPLFVTLAFTVMTLVGRVLYVIDERSWWILHPDEVYQSMEVAHSEVYGFGYRTFEYLAPASKGDDLSQYQQREQQLGMHALRSPLYPHFYVTVSWMTESLGCHADPYTVWRIAHVTVSSLLPLATHVLASWLSGCYEAGALSAVLVASCAQLHVLGTHTLVHSFLAPLIFLSLAGLLRLLLPPHTPPSVPLDDQQPSISNRTVWTVSKLQAVITAKLAETKTYFSALLCQHPISAQLFSIDENFNHKHLTLSASSRDCYSHMGQSNCSSSSTNTDQTMPATTIQNGKTKSCSNVATSGRGKPFFTFGVKLMACSFVLAVTCYVRPDSVLIVLALLAPYLSTIVKQEHCSRSLAACVTGGILGVLVGVAEDFHFYGCGVFSPINWFTFNVVSNSSWMYFGGQPGSFYIHHVLWSNSYMIVLFGINITVMICMTWQERAEMKITNTGNRFVRQFLLLLSLVFLMAVYSMQKHKEVRFVHHVIVLYLIFTAVNLLFIAQKITDLKNNNNNTLLLRYSRRFSGNKTVRKMLSRLTILTIVMIFMFTQWNDFPSQGNESFRRWVYQGSVDNHDVMKCVNYVAEQDDVHGVFLDKHIHSFGGYSSLRRDVPLLTLTYKGYHELGTSARSKVKPKLHLVNTNNISIAISNKVSNVFLPENTGYLMRHLIEHAEYNYLVMDKSRVFFPGGYEEVFASGGIKVVKRLASEAGEGHLQSLLSAKAVTPRPETLVKEAAELFAFGLYQLADERYTDSKKN